MTVLRIKNWEELEPGMVVTPAMSTAHYWVIFFFLGGGDRVGPLSDVGTVTILRNHLKPRSPDARGTSRSNLRLLSVLAKNGVFTLATTGECPVQWRVTA